MIVELFIMAFAVFLGLNLIRGDSNYIYFSRWVTWINSFKTPSPNPPKDTGHCLVVEYKIDGRSFGVVVRKKREPLGWKQVGACVDIQTDQWIDITKEANFYGGIYKDFHMKDVKPVDMNPDYKKIAFAFGESNIVYVDAEQVIIKELIKPPK